MFVIVRCLFVSYFAVCNHHQSPPDSSSKCLFSSFSFHTLYTHTDMSSETSETSDTLALDPQVWGPHYWFFLHTVARTYPRHPNAVTKRKYYDLVQSLPLFLPDRDIAARFSRHLEEFPVSSFLDNRASLEHWMHTMHNRVNEQLEKPILSVQDAQWRYQSAYHRTASAEAFRFWKRCALYLLLSGGAVGLIAYLYDRE